MYEKVFFNYSLWQGGNYQQHNSEDKQKIKLL